jgi:hypothetical protein
MRCGVFDGRSRRTGFSVAGGRGRGQFDRKRNFGYAEFIKRIPNVEQGISNVKGLFDHADFHTKGQKIERER